MAEHNVERRLLRVERGTHDPMAESERDLFNRLVRAHDLDVVWCDAPVLSLSVKPPAEGRGVWLVLVERRDVIARDTLVEWWDRDRLLQQAGFRGQPAWIWRTLGRDPDFHGDFDIRCTVGCEPADRLTISAAAGRGMISQRQDAR